MSTVTVLQLKIIIYDFMLILFASRGEFTKLDADQSGFISKGEAVMATVMMKTEAMVAMVLSN